MKNALLIILFLFTGHSLLAQGKTQLAPPTKLVTVKTINKAFSCPVLTPRLINRVQKSCNASVPSISEDKSRMVFDMPVANEISSDSIVKLALKSGFPPGYITVEITDKK